MMVLVTGGAASGKSEYAERLVCGELPEAAEAPAAEGPRIYVAAMQPFGSEAEERIRRSQSTAGEQGPFRGSGKSDSQRDVFSRRDNGPRGDSGRSRPGASSA